MFTKKDISFQFNASNKSWTMTLGGFACDTHLGIARPSKKPNQDSQDQFVFWVNEKALNNIA